MKKELGKNIKYFNNDVWYRVNPENKSMLDFYLMNKKSLKASSIRQYENGIRIFLLWLCECSENESIINVKKRKILEYQNWLIEQGLTYNSVIFKRNSLSAFFDFISEYFSDEYPEFKNIIKEVPMPKNEHLKEKRYLDKKELNMIREELSRVSKYNQLAYVEISFLTGLSKEEILELKRDIVDIHYNNDGMYPIKVGNRKVYFDEHCMSAIRNYLKTRDDENEYIFVTNKENEVVRLNPTTFNFWCANRISKILGRDVKPSLLYKKSKK